MYRVVGGETVWVVADFRIGDMSSVWKPTTTFPSSCLSAIEPIRITYSRQPGFL